MANPFDDLAQARALEYSIAQKDLGLFVQAAWPVLEPDTPLLWNWHHDLICEHLQATRTGEIRRLIINIAPRTTKSILTTISFPSWVWTTEPSSRFLFGSYSAPLTTKHSVLRRNLIESAWYQQGYGGKFRMASDVNMKTEFANDKTGTMRVASIQSVPMGEGADYIIIDDPHNPQGAESTLDRERAIQNFDLGWTTRLNNKKTGRIIIVMQRLHEKDLTGHLLERGGYVHLKIPTIAEARERIVFPVTGRIVEREAGSLMHPERDRPEDIEQAKLDLGVYGFCTPKESPILMADLSLRPIGEIQVGNRIIGFTTKTESTHIGDSCSRRKLVQTEVLAISQSVQPVVKITLDSGKIVRCTAHHKWYTGRGSGRPLYLPATVGRTLFRVCDDRMPHLEPGLERDAGWLAGFFDGEGSAVLRKDGNGCLITFTQGAGRNLPLCHKLEHSLTSLGFEFGMAQHVRDDRKRYRETAHMSRIYYLKKDNAIRVAQRFLHLVRPSKWVDRIAQGALSAKFISARERVVAIEPDGTEDVYGLTTGTGNYVVWGLASSNSGQHQQSPTPAKGGHFTADMFEFVEALPPKWDYEFITADTAYSDKQSADFTVFTAFGVAEGELYIQDVFRKQIKASEIEVPAEMFIRRFTRPGFRGAFIEPKGHGIYLNQVLPKKGLLIPPEDKIREFFMDRRLSKVERALNAVPWLANQKVKIYSRIADKEILLAEVLKFPRADFDDFADTLIDGIRFAFGFNRTGTFTEKMAQSDRSIVDEAIASSDW